MQVYQELTLLPNADDDMSLYFLWGKLYQQLHLAWVEAKDDKGKVSTGVSFPGYDLEQRQLGNKIRIFSSVEKELEALNLSKWLSRLTDYVHVASVRPVPDIASGHVLFKRQQTKSSVARIARRKAKHQNLSLSESLQSLQAQGRKYSNAPFIHLKSHSTSSAFRLMITREEASSASFGSGFSTFGLSSAESKNTVPLF